MLTIKNLSGAFINADGEEPVLNNVNLKIDPGQTVALVGESGSGKSVTALTVLGLLPRESFHHTGKIIFRDKELTSADPKELEKVRGNQISMIFQEPMTSLNPVYTIGKQLAEPLRLHRRLQSGEIEKEAIYLLKRCGIQDPKEKMNSFPHQLSGGQRQRAMIAMALSCRPRLLIADEPTTALDVTIQAQILTLLKELQEEFNMAIWLITHDLNLVKKSADQLYIMNKGHIVENGETSRIFKAPSHPYTKSLLASIPAPKQTLEAGGPKQVVIRDLHCHFRSSGGIFQPSRKVVKAVDGVSLSISQGTTCAIIGESGSGKTTLGMSILRLNQSHGSIKFKGTELLNLNNKQMQPLRKKMQVVFQDPYSSLSPRMTIGQIIGEGLKIHKIGNSRHERMELAAQNLTEVGLEAEMVHRYPHEFSGGQRQRIAIARAMALTPELLILDEPTSALDVTIQNQIIKLLLHLQGKYQITYVFISHDLRVVRSLADQIAVMKDGCIVESGPAAEIIANPQHHYTRRLFTAAFN